MHRCSVRLEPDRLNAPPRSELEVLSAITQSDTTTTSFAMVIAPPLVVALPPVRVKPEKFTWIVPSPLTLNNRLVAPVGLMFFNVKEVAPGPITLTQSVTNICPDATLIVCGAENTP